MSSFRDKQQQLLHYFWNKCKALANKVKHRYDLYTICGKYNRSLTIKSQRNLSLCVSVVTERALFCSTGGNPHSCDYVWVGLGVDERLVKGIWVHSMDICVFQFRFSLCANELVFNQVLWVQRLKSLLWQIIYYAGVSRTCSVFGLSLYSRAKWSLGVFLIPPFPPRTLEGCGWRFRWKPFPSKGCAVHGGRAYRERGIGT